MKKIKRIIKFFAYILVFFGFFLLFAEFALRYILPLPSVKNKLLNTVSSSVGADIKAGDISAGLFGIEIDAITLDTQKGNVFTCKDLKIKLNPFKLLIGQIDIKDIYIYEPVIQIIRFQDGSFNFSPLVSSSEEETKNSQEENKNDSDPIDLKVKNLNLINAKVFYLDLQENMKANVRNLTLSVQHFSYDKPFNINFSFDPYFEQKDLILEGAHIALNAKTNLNNLDMEKASLNLKNLLFKYKEAVFEARADVNNFENPSVKFDMKLKNFSNETLLAFGKTPAFTLPLTSAKGALSYQNKNSKLDIQNLILQIADTKLDFKGHFLFDKDLAAQGKIVLNSVLDTVENHSPVIAQYKPKGQILADFDFSLPLGLTGKLDLKNIGFFVDTAGTFENINASAEIGSIDEIKINSFEGLLNKNPFTLQASYLKKKDFADVFLDFKAEKLYLINSANKEENKTEQVSQEESSPAKEQATQEEETSTFVPININANINIGKMDVPYLRGNKLNFTAKAKNITPKMDKTHGTFNLSVQDGQIKDVYTLANANAVAKVMFMSLGIVSRVINTLNVLDLLNGMGKVLSGKKETEEDIPQHQEINGKMDFDSFDTKIDFNQGVATMKKCSFVSDLFSFRVNGNINFDNRKIKLNVDSAPGKHTEDGIMPLNIDIKGTIEEPKGSLSVLSSVSALVGDTVMNNPVSNMLKKGWGKLFSSSKDEEEAIAQETLPQEPNTTENKTENTTENTAQNTTEEK